MRPLEIVGHGTLSRRFADCPLHHGREDCAVDWNNRRARTLKLLRRASLLATSSAELLEHRKSPFDQIEADDPIAP
jgi:hypothetical protein